MAERGVAPVVGKVLEIGLVLLVVGALSASLFGGFVPAVREQAGTAVADRALATAAASVEGAVPATGRNLRVRTAVDIPARVRGQAYTVRAENETLVLDHPDPSIGGRSRLSLSDRVVAVEGAWNSTERTVVVVRSTADGVVVRLA